MLKEEKIKIVRDAIDIISSQDSWTDGPLAAYRETYKNKKDELVTRLVTVDPTSSKATCWCAIGAIVKVSPYDHTVRDEIREFCKKQYGITLADMNDFHGRKKVIFVLQEYMNVLEQDE